MALSDTLINTLFDGRYRVLRKLGTGGMANVYLAEDQELGRRVAIKILDDRHAHDEQFVERFRREAKNAAGLSHPNIVSIYDRGEAEGTYYIAMEYLDGRTLKELIVRRGPAPVKVSIEYVRQILAALRFAHRNGIVHRDIKPHNVLVDSEGRLKVTDFGIARAGTSQMTEAGSIIGTAQYLSPEQAKGAPVDQTSDLYSVGVVLYELLTGEVPYTGDTPVEIAMKHLSAIPTVPSTLRPEIPHELDSVILRALGKEPAERYGSAEEMDADLQRVANGLPIDPATEEAATMIVSRPQTAATMIVPPPAGRAPVYAPAAPPPPVYYDYDEPISRPRAIWPWLLALLLVVAAALAGWYVYTQIQDQLNGNRPIAVGNYAGQREGIARENVIRDGFRPVIIRRPTDVQPATFVYRQEPAGGNRIDRGNQVTIFVSTGKPRTTVPDVRGKSSTDAVQALADAGLKADPHQVPSDKAQGTVTAQDPLGNVRVVRGTKVRINISSGPQPVAVPSVVGQPYDAAALQLQNQGFAVARNDVPSNDSAGNVVSQSPAANASVAKGSTITLSVSKGPTTTDVPNVVGSDGGSAEATLIGSGFTVKRIETDVSDPSQDGVVQDQSPPSGTPAKPGSKVTITVARLVADTTQTTAPTTPTPIPTTP